SFAQYGSVAGHRGLGPAQPGHQQPDLEVVEPATEGGHDANASARDGRRDRIGTAAIEPDPIVETRRAEQWIAIARRPMAGAAILLIDRPAGMIVGRAPGIHPAIH